MFEAPRHVQSAAAIGGDGAAIDFPAAAAIDLRHLLSVLWRDKTTILWTTIAALCVAILFVLVVPHRYTAVTQILIDPTDLRAVGNDLAPASAANDAAVLQIESQVRVLTSDSVLQRVVTAQGLDRDPQFVGNNGGDPVTAALNSLKRRVQVKRAERTYVVDVSVTAREAGKAAEIANAIAQAYLEEQTIARSDAARQVSQSLSARLDELRERVRQAEDRAEAFKARNNLVGANGQLVDEQQLAEMNNQLGIARARTAAAKARLDQIQQAQLSRDEIGAFPEAVQSQTITALRSQYAEIMRRQAEQMTSLGVRHPAVIEIQAEADRLHHMIEDEVRRIAQSARAEYESARANEAAIAANLDKLKNSAIASNEAMVTLRELDREVQANRAVYEAFLVRARETGEQERVDTKNIRVISRASVPMSRSFPPSNFLLAVCALLFGVTAGTAIVLARDAYDSGRPRRDDGGTAALAGKVANAVRGLRRAVTRTTRIPVLAVLPDVDVSFGLSAAEDPGSRLAVELRKIHAGVNASRRPRPNSSILVVAAGEEDGVVAVALMLAAVAAATQRVLLIDSDLERRTLSAIDADHSEAGLVDIAVGRRGLADAVVRDRDSNINLMSFVSPTSRRDRRISEADIKAAFDQTKRFDMVIVAAVDLSRNPSTSFFAGLVDHIVLVARTDDRSATAVEQFVSRLGPDGRKVRGTVLVGSEHV